MVKNRKGQSTLEYIILVTAVIVVIISFMVGPNTPFKQTLNSTLNTTVGYMNDMTGRLGVGFGNIGG